jgi:hypothetical protein
MTSITPGINQEPSSSHKALHYSGYPRPRTASLEKKREYLGKCDNLYFKEKKSYLKR